MKDDRNTYDKLAEAYWKWAVKGFHIGTAVARFKQKYEWEDRWNVITCWIDPWDSNCDPATTNIDFDYDFCEGQTDFQLIGFKELRRMVDEWDYDRGTWEQ